MKTRTILCVVSLVVFFCMRGAAQLPQPADPFTGKKYVEGQMLVRFRPGTRPALIRTTHQMLAADVVQSFEGTEGLQLVKVSIANRLPKVLAAYRSNPNVLYAEPNYVLHALQTPNDSLFSSMWPLLNTGQVGGTPGADIKATQAWNISTGDKNVVVAVIDTGVDYNHPDLAANIFTGPICPGGVICHGINTISVTGIDPNDPLDDNGHGTHVSGTIGAVGNNALGVTGINWNVTILPCKFLNSGGFGDTAGAIRCLDFIKGLKDSGMNIVASNNSWGGGPFSQALQDAIDRQGQSGILFIAAAGNDFNDNDALPSYPASYPLPNIITVAATDRNDQRAFFSNVGQHTVHIGAPGQDILSTFMGGGYATESGTSMATPHVTGVAALLAAQDPARDWRAIKNLILAGGDANASMARTVTGKRLNAFGAMTCTNSPLAARLLPATDVVSGTVGVAITLSALNINCAQPTGAVQVTVSPSGQALTLTDDGVAPDQAAGDGIYSGAFTPPTTGVYTLTFSTGGTVTVQVLTPYQPAVAAFNYRVIAGTSLDLGDDGVAQIISPFPIPFGNGSFNTLWASANGTISFSSAVSSYVNVFMPTASPLLGNPPLVQASTLVAPFWDDLYPLKGTVQNVFWDVVGTAPNRELVVEWRDVRAFDCLREQDTVKFQIVFFESNSDVLFNYADTVFGGACSGHDRGGSATVGVQVAPTIGTQWGRDGQEVNDGMALIWHVSGSLPTPGPPTVTSIAPIAVDAYGPDFTLTVNGANFFPDSRVVRFGGFDRITTFVSSNQLTALIPAADIDLFQIFTNTMFYGARNGGPTATNFSNFTAQLTVNNPSNPTITSASPAAGTANSFAFILTVNGDGFSPFSVLNFNGQPLQTSPQSRTKLLATVPGTLVSSVQTAILTVTNPAPGGGVSPAFPYPVAASAGTAPAGVGPFLTQHGFGTLLPPIVPASSKLPQRFLGWNYAQRVGPEYLQRFTRPYGQMFTAHSDKPPISPTPSAVGPSIVPPLIDLNLRGSTPAGFIPTGIATGDFNHDGHLDWVVSNGGSNDLWLYLGNGDGTSQPPRIIPLSGQTPVQIIAADLRGIGVLDLILAEPDSISVGVLLGNGDGTFGPETLYFAPAPVLSIAVADFNGDKHLDVVAGLLATNETGGVAFFAGDGAGRLQPPLFTPIDTIFANPVIAVGLAAGDLNGDGIPDLAVVDQDLVDESGVYVYFGVGNGTFKPGQNQGGLMNAAIGDLNGDGCNDLVTLSPFGIAQVSLGHCDGTFTLLPGGFAFGEGESTIGMALVDVNGDGKLDLVASGVDVLGLAGGFGQESGALVSVLLGDGTGSFENARVFRAQSGMVALAVGDLNGDLHPDIVAPSQDTDSVSVLLNDGTGNFGGPQGLYIGWNQKGNPIVGGAANAPVAAYVADVDGDGKLDVVAVDDGQFGGLPSNVSVSLNDGTGHFLPDIKSPILEGAFEFGNLVLGDFRKTGRPDLVVTPTQFGATLSGNFFSFVPNTGLGHYGQPLTTAIPHLPGTLAVGDFNGDGNLDFVMVGFSGATPPEEIDTFLGNGDGTFRAGPTQRFVANLPPGTVYVGDFNGDGKLDVLVPITLGAFQTPTLLEFLGIGDGSFAPPVTVLTDSPTGSSVVSNLFNVVDVNHDGRSDLIQKGAFTGQGAPVFRIFLAQPDGSFVLANTYSPYAGVSLGVFGAPLQFTESFVADFNGDGNVDIASLQADPGFPAAKFVQFMLGNGDGTFVPTFTRFPLGITVNAALPAITGDMNGDGHADFVELDGVTSAFHVISALPGTSLRLQFLALPVIGSTGSVRASLALPAAADTVVTVSASDPAIAVPASIVISAGTLSQDATVQVGPAFDRSKTFTVTASIPGETSTALASVAAPGGAVGLVVATVNFLGTLLPGQSTGDLGLVVASRGGYQTSVNLRCDGLPAGATCQFGHPNLLVPSGGSNGSTLVISISTPLAVGNYPFQIVASDSIISQSLPLTLRVGDFAVALVDSSAVALPTGFATVQVAVTSINNFVGNVNFTCQGLPTGASCLSANTIAGLGPSGLGVAVSTTNVPVGNYPFTITGDTGFTTHSVNAVLHVGDVGSGAITPSTATLTVGQSANFALTVNSVNGFTGSLQLFCNPTVNGRFVNGVQCAFSPQTATFDATGKLSSQLTVTITSRPASAIIRKEVSGTFNPMWLALLFVPAAIFVGRKGSRQRMFLGFCLGIMALSLIASCGGSGSSPAPPTPTPIPSPSPVPGPETVSVDVVATSPFPQAINRVVANVKITVQ